jgi:hypothetical protein
MTEGNNQEKKYAVRLSIALYELWRAPDEKSGFSAPLQFLEL